MRRLTPLAVTLFTAFAVAGASLSFNDAATVPTSPFGVFGDDIHDDTSALQSAINTVAVSSVTNGLLIIPAGTYKITSQLTVPPVPYATNAPVGSYSGVTIKGAGMGKTILDFSGIGNGIGLALTNYAYDGVVIQDLTVSGPYNTASTSVGIAFGNAASYTNAPINHTSAYAGALNALRNVAILGFGYGLTLTNQWQFQVDTCTISSNTFFGIQSVNSHGDHIKNSTFLGGFGVPGGTAIGLIGAGSALADNGLIESCGIYWWSNAIENEEAQLTCIDNHLEDCNLYYLSKITSGYSALSWQGGYILERVANLAWFGAAQAPAMMQFSRYTAKNALVENADFDNFATLRPFYNIISSSDGFALIFPTTYLPYYVGTKYVYTALADTTNSYTVPLAIQPNPVPSSTMVGINPGFTGPANNFSGWVGCIFTVGTNDLWLTSMGRFSIYGFTNKTHRILMLNYADNTTNGFVDLPITPTYCAYVWSPCSIYLPAGSTNTMLTDTLNPGDYFQNASPSNLDTNIVKFWATFGATPIGNGISTTNNGYGPLNFTYQQGAGTHMANALTPGTAVYSSTFVTSTNGFVSYATNIFTSVNSAGFTNDTAHSWGTNTVIVDIISSGETVAFYNRSGAGGQTSCGTLLFTDTAIANKEYVVGVNCGVKFSVGTFTSGTARGF